ncbi:DUF1330 domain-containing protein [Kordiimonas sp.]|uniref:DUF1330 domain-containing protein n=1 Tax=Kordiimonas sp. TaxID=1970157 RepID=UPI003A8DF75F
MTVNHENETLLASLLDAYGSGQDGNSPTEAQWQRLIERDASAPLVLVNYFKLRAAADYAGTSHAGAAPVSGQEAFGRYSAVSMPALTAAGGRFLHMGAYEGGFLGEDEDWHMVAIGHYPNMEAFWKLYRNPEYIAAFCHRAAACERQKVVVLG